MQAVATTRMSSKGQVVIPEDVRVRLGLMPGAEFVVVADRDFVVFKRLTPPPLAEFDALLANASRQAKQAGMKRADVTAAVRKARTRT